jgi:hypothetical protein
MTMVVVCGDSTQPVEGAALSACTAPAWTDSQNLPAPNFDVSTLDPGTITAYFAWGWFVVAMGWAIGYGFKIVIKFLWGTPT